MYKSRIFDAIQEADNGLIPYYNLIKVMDYPESGKYQELI